MKPLLQLSGLAAVAATKASGAIGGPLPGFEHVRRFWDPVQKYVTVKVLPGEFYVSSEDELITTVLGSCVATCIHDPRRRVGGINHFMLPEPLGEKEGWSPTVSRAARYGSDAMEQLINVLLAGGSLRSDLQVKLFGGGRVLSQLTEIGQRNIDFARRYLVTEKLTLVASDLGDVYPRQIQYFPRTGRARVRLLRRQDETALMAGEHNYLKRLANDPITGSVELF